MLQFLYRKCDLCSLTLPSYPIEKLQFTIYENYAAFIMIATVLIATIANWPSEMTFMFAIFGFSVAFLLSTFGRIISLNQPNDGELRVFLLIAWMIFVILVAIYFGTQTQNLINI
ncbi:MAG: hypothetical protein HeimC2_44300 [Candidatus Heimdallarchaeota archaeon LC_2]|nr:MAG: hypothetical protein HeimC2_44300 [Candidatus Heimdallarchaeota archaeon LC_2]